jgi:hypothetical protein
LRTPTKKLQGVAFDRKPRLPLDEIGQLLQGTQQQVDDETAAAALNVVMMPSAMPDFITHLSFMKPNWIYQTQLLEHGKIPIDRHQIDDMTPFPKTRMNLSRRNR